MAEAVCISNADAWNVLLKFSKRPRKEREEFPREVFKTSPWQEMIDSGSYKLQTTKQGRNFRRKFRLPASMFDWIVATVLHLKLFPEFRLNGSASDAFGRPVVSLHVKILCVFRVLGSGCDFTAVYDGSKVDAQTARKFFHTRQSEMHASSLHMR